MSSSNHGINLESSSKIFVDEPPLLWREDKPYRCAPPITGDPWTVCLNSVRNYDDEKCKGWREDIDTLLVFAGLFSATVTAFAAESYQWLQPDPESAILTQLVYISEQLNGLTSLTPTTAAAFSPTPASVRINAFWFLSLTISLATVLIGILCKQWLREYQKDASVGHHLALELRQMRYESLQKWGVPGILNALPLLLQLALVLFFAGMLDLLWSLSSLVAGLVTAVVGLSMLIVIVTSVLPTCYLVLMQRCRTNSSPIFPCPYKSPQSWLFHRLVLSIGSLIPGSKLATTRYSDWVSFDLHLLRAMNSLAIGDTNTLFLQRGLQWVVGTFGDSIAMTRHVFHCLQSCSTQEFAYATRQDLECSRDSLNLNFLESHPWDESDFAIRRFAIELSLRQLNNPTGSSANASNLLHKVAALVYHDGLPDLGEELWGQIIASIRNHLSTDRACADDILSLLEIFENCWPPPSAALQHHAFLFLDDFQDWIERTTHADVLRARVSETACSLTRIIHYMVHYFATDLVSSTRFADFARFVDQYVLLLGIDARSLRTGGSTWQETKRILASRSDLPPDYFPTYTTGVNDFWPLKSVSRSSSSSTLSSFESNDAPSCRFTERNENRSAILPNSSSSVQP